MPKIRFKRGLEATIPQLELGEPGFTTDTKEIFIGSDTGNIQLAKKEDVDSVDTKVNGKADQSYVTTQLETVNTALAQNTANIVVVAPNGTDDTNAIQSVLDANDIPRLISGTYIVSSLVLNDNAKIITSGYKTKLKQKAGLSGDIRILTIQGSNVVVDEMTYEGNISTDTGEQRHAVFIRNSTKEISNITVKGISASNVRGDGLYIGGVTGYNPKNVTIGNVTVTNCYRNGVSLTGGNNITIGDIYAVNCGMMGVDLESDTAGGYLNNIKIGNIITSSLGIIASGSGYPFVENVELGFVECRKSRNTSSPDYPPLTQDQDAVTFRNARNIKIKGLDIDGFDRHAILFLLSGSDRFNDNIEIDFLTVKNCSLTDTSYNSYVQLSGVNNLKIKNLVSTTQSGKELFLGSSYTVPQQNIIVEKANHNGGRFARYCGLYAKNITAVSDTVVFSYLKELSRIESSTITGTIIISYSVNVIFDGCKLTHSTSKESNGVNQYKNNIINGAFVA